MSEPDRFEEKARELVDLFVTTGTHVTEMRSSLAAAIRQAADEALERAARDFDREAERLEQDARKLDADGQGMAAAAHFHDARVAEANANRIRALASPAAAPAAETSDEEARRLSTFDAQLAKARCESLAGSVMARCNCYPRIQGSRVEHKETCPMWTAEPAPLLPRVLAALEGESTIAAAHGWLDRVALLDALAAELRAYIAERKTSPASAREMYWYEQAHEAWRARDSAVAVNEADLKDLTATKDRADAAEKRIAELERVIDLSYPFVAEGDENTTVDGLTQEQIVRHINSVMRAATAKGEGR